MEDDLVRADGEMRGIEDPGDAAEKRWASSIARPEIRALRRCEGEQSDGRMEDRVLPGRPP
ncbi:MAG: hypothetical protein R3D03_04600 [Geminicoccaceae bacterium]